MAHRFLGNFCILSLSYELNTKLILLTSEVFVMVTIKIIAETCTELQTFRRNLADSNFGVVRCRWMQNCSQYLPTTLHYVTSRTRIIFVNRSSHSRVTTTFLMLQKFFPTTEQKVLGTINVLKRLASVCSPFNCSDTNNSVRLPFIQPRKSDRKQPQN